MPPPAASSCWSPSTRERAAGRPVDSPCRMSISGRSSLAAPSHPSAFNMTEYSASSGPHYDAGGCVARKGREQAGQARILNLPPTSPRSGRGERGVYQECSREEDVRATRPSRGLQSMNMTAAIRQATTSCSSSHASKSGRDKNIGWKLRYPEVVVGQRKTTKLQQIDRHYRSALSCIAVSIRVAVDAARTDC